MYFAGGFVRTALLGGDKGDSMKRSSRSKRKAGGGENAIKCWRRKNQEKEED